MDFPDSSIGKESTCNAGDPGSIEGIGYPLQYSWASLVAQLVKNLPATLGTFFFEYLKMVFTCVPYMIFYMFQCHYLWHINFDIWQN